MNSSVPRGGTSETQPDGFPPEASETVFSSTHAGQLAGVGSSHRD